MGSGLILLLIVGAWLAVLVPMALRSHDTATAASTVERFSDAMRVLSRRSTGVAAPVDDVPLVPPPVRRPRRGPTAAARRRRALGVLVLVALATLAGAVVGPRWLLVPQVVADLLLVGLLVWLRSTATARAEREWRTALGDRRRPGDEAAWSPLREWSPEAAAPTAQRVRAPHVAAAAVPAARGTVPAQVAVFDQEVAEPAAHVPAARSRADVPAEAPAATADAAPAVRAPARGAQGEPWSPVPLPVPTYVTAPRAPRRVIDLTGTGPVAAEALTAAERSLGIDDRGPELEHILGRRAVGG